MPFLRRLPCSRTVMSTFDSRPGDTLTSTGADGNTTTKTYYGTSSPSEGLVYTSTDPDGTKTTYTYNGAGEVTQQAVTFGSYTATTLNAYDSSGRLFCTVAPIEAALGKTCPSSAPTSPPTGTTYYTNTIYNSNNQVTSTTNPIGGTTLYAYDGAGDRYCTVTPFNYTLEPAAPRCHR